jgi:hypothetical protein
MGSHSKPRATGRKTALGALAVGATLTGVGLTAAALDPATAVLSADSAPGNGSSIQLSGLADPVAISPQTVTTTLRVLTAAPSTASIPSTSAAATKTVSTVAHSTPAKVSRPITSAISSRSAKTRSTSADSSSGKTAIRPIRQGSGTLTSGYTGKHRQTRTAPAPVDQTETAFSDLLDSTPLAGLLGSGPLADLLSAAGLLGGGL